MSNETQTQPTPIVDIADAIARITGIIDPIAKTHENKQQRFKFRGIDDVMAVLNLLLADHGVAITVDKTTVVHQATYESKNGFMQWWAIIVDYRLTHAGTKTYLIASYPGESIDTFDKGLAKCMAGAYRTMALHTFCIPAGDKMDPNYDVGTTDDTQTTESAETPATPPPRKVLTPTGPVPKKLNVVRAAAPKDEPPDDIPMGNAEPSDDGLSPDDYRNGAWKEVVTAKGNKLGAASEATIRALAGKDDGWANAHPINAQVRIAARVAIEDGEMDTIGSN